MPITTFPMGYLGTNCHVVTHGTDALMVDPGGTMEHGLSAACDHISKRNLTLQAVLLTHLHFDHIYGVAAMLRLFPGLKAYANEADLEILHSPLAAASTFGLPKTEPFDPVSVTEGAVSFGSIRGEIRFTPGHTPGGLILYLPDERAVLSGDTLFYRAVGRTDLFGGNASELHDSLVGKLLTLPDDTTVYPGHGPETTIGAERACNPFL